MGFFSDIIGGLGKVLGGGSGVGSLIDLGTGIYGLSQARRGRNDLQGVLASLSPNSPEFKNLVSLLEEENRRRAVEQVNRVMRLDKRARARGDPGFIVNPERRDESRYRALLESYQNAGQRARQEASGLLNQRFGNVAGVTRQIGALRTGEAEAIGRGVNTGLKGLADVLTSRRLSSGPYAGSPTGRTGFEGSPELPSQGYPNQRLY